jgi:PPM family protein phosphatase
MAELRIGAATDTGRIRPENEDNFLVTETTFVVADGMGGHEAGEVASQIAVDGIRQRLDDIAAAASEQSDAVVTLPTAAQFVDSITVANSDIFRAAILNPAQRGMGTTVTAIAVIADHHAGRAAPNVSENAEDEVGDAPGDTDAPAPGDVTPVTPVVPSEALVLANVGDSRTYLFRHGRLRRVTIDHSYVQELVATGHITEDEARTHPRRNIITRALGIEPEVRVDWWTLPLIRGDRFVLCSDGLVDEVPDSDITTVLLDNDDPQDAAERLIDAANAAGGRDNTTVIVVDVLEGDEPPDPTLEIDVVPTWADDANRPTAAGPLSLDADARSGTTGALLDPTGPLDRSAIAASAEEGDGRRRSGLVKFAIAFGAAAAIVIAFVVFSVWASSGYFIAFNEDDQAIVYKGRQGGVLWIDPTAQNDAGPTRDQLDADRAEEIDDGVTFDSQQEAAEFIRSSATTTTTTTTTTSTTTTTTTVPTTDPLGGAVVTTATGDASAPTGATTIAAP